MSLKKLFSFHPYLIPRCNLTPPYFNQKYFNKVNHQEITIVYPNQTKKTFQFPVPLIATVRKTAHHKQIQVKDLETQSVMMEKLKKKEVNNDRIREYDETLHILNEIIQILTNAYLDNECMRIHL